MPESDRSVFPAERKNPIEQIRLAISFISQYKILHFSQLLPLQVEHLHPIIGPGNVSGKSGSCLTTTLFF